MGVNKRGETEMRKVTNEESHERRLIDWIRRRVPGGDCVTTGVGDDTAVLAASPLPWLATVDMLIEGVHFDLSKTRPREVGRKAMAVNLSDIAAMAGEPAIALVAMGVPQRHEIPNLAEEVMEGMARIADEFHVAIVGGDTNASPGGMVLSVTLLGHPTGSGAVLRSEAKVGDAVCVTGSLGYSLAGRHANFMPRVREAMWLHQNFKLHSMIDLSDGLASDLYHILDESGVGARIDVEAIPIAKAQIQDDRPPIEHALHDGEDFELLFTLSEEESRRLLTHPFLFDVPCTRIGTITEPSKVTLCDSTGLEIPLERGGYAHDW